MFLNRAGFNGMIRFNRKGGFNVPFCKKPTRFAKAYVTKIVNQVDKIATVIKNKEFVFICQHFEETIKMGSPEDLIYCDPPYIARYADYYNGWYEKDEKKLFEALCQSPSRFILSTWHHNSFRKNSYIDSLWSKFQIQTKAHFYHVGASERNRNPMTEALVMNQTKVDTQR